MRHQPGQCVSLLPAAVPAQHGGSRRGWALNAAALARRGGNAAAATAPLAGPGPPRGAAHGPAPPFTVRGCGRRGGLGCGRCELPHGHRPSALGGERGEGAGELPSGGSVVSRVSCRVAVRTAHSVSFLIKNLQRVYVFLGHL